MKKKILRVDNNSGRRLDKYMASKLNLSRTKIKKLIEKKLVKVDGRFEKPHYNVLQDQIISCRIPEEKKHIKPGKVEFETIFADDDIIVVNKPAGVVTHPAPTVKEATLLNALASRYPHPHIVHRLDKETSGIMLVALNERAALNLRKQFKKRKVKKVYNCLVEGKLEKSSGEIAAPIKRSLRDRTKMKVGWTGARKSTTRFSVLEKFNNATFLEVYPLTGRTHQIRVHMSYYGHPVMGDKKYSLSPPACARQLLHARHISFRHPGSKRRVYFSSSLPEDFTNMLDKLKRAKKLKIK